MYGRFKCQLGARTFIPNRLIRSTLAALRTAAKATLVATWLWSAGAAHAQQAGYMRVVTSSGHQIPGESTDPAHYGWIPFRQATMPTPSEIDAISKESADSATSAAKSVHRPVVIIKDRDTSSLGLLAGMTSHERFPQIDVVLTQSDRPLAKYKLTGATIISVRAGGTDGGTDAPEEQLRLNYAKIEIEH